MKLIDKIRKVFHRHRWRVGALIMERCKYILPIIHCKDCDSYILVNPRNTKKGRRLHTNPLDIYPMADCIIWKGG
jgi:hypothetical protein